MFKGTESYEEDISSLHYAATFLPVKLVNMYGPATDFHSDVRFLKLSLSAIFRNLCAKLFASKLSVRAIHRHLLELRQGVHQQELDKSNHQVPHLRHLVYT